MPKKNRLKIRPEGLAWLATKCNEKEFNRVLALFDRGQVEALLLYLKSITDEDTYRQFEEANLPPEIVAARRKAEAEQKQREEDERRTIRNGDMRPITDKDILSGAGWRPLGPSKEERESQREFAEIGEPEFNR